MIVVSFERDTYQMCSKRPTETSKHQNPQSRSKRSYLFPPLHQLYLRMQSRTLSSRKITHKWLHVQYVKHTAHHRKTQYSLSRARTCIHNVFKEYVFCVLCSHHPCLEHPKTCEEMRIYRHHNEISIYLPACM